MCVPGWCGTAQHLLPPLSLLEMAATAYPVDRAVLVINTSSGRPGNIGQVGVAGSSRHQNVNSLAQAPAGDIHAKICSHIFHHPVLLRYFSLQVLDLVQGSKLQLII